MSWVELYDLSFWWVIGCALLSLGILFVLWPMLYVFLQRWPVSVAVVVVLAFLACLIQGQLHFVHRALIWWGAP